MPKLPHPRLKKAEVRAPVYMDDLTGEHFTEAGAMLLSDDARTGGGLWSDIKGMFSQGTKSASNAVSLVAPWLTNVVWTINRAFAQLARDAYGQNSVVYACLRLLSQSVGEAKLAPLRVDDRLDKLEVSFEHPLFQLIRAPNELLTTYEFIEICVLHLGAVGRCHWWKERDQLNRVIGLWPLRPDRVGPIYAAVDEQTGGATAPMASNKVLWGWAYWPPGKGQAVRIPANDVITINLPDPAGETGGVVEGLGPMQVLAREIEADNEATSFVAALLKNYAMPGAILHVKASLLRDGAAKFKREFKRTFGGTRRGEIAVFDGDTAFETIGFNMQELEFPNLRKVSEARIAAAFGIPPALVGFAVGVESANRSTLSEYREYFAETTLPAWWRRIQEALTRDLAYEFGDDLIIEFDTRRVKALTLQSSRQIQPFQLAFTAGAITVDEYRVNVLNIDPLPDGRGDVLYVPSMVTPTNEPGVTDDDTQLGITDEDTPWKPGQTHDEDPRTMPTRLVRNRQVNNGRIENADSPARTKSARVDELRKHIGDRNKPWVPPMSWRRIKYVLDAAPQAEEAQLVATPAKTA